MLRPGRFIVYLMAVVIAGGCGTANSWETCTDGFHIYNPSGSVPSSAYDQFKDKYCALNYAYASCSCAEVEKSCGDKDISYKAEENEYCVNCDIFGDCKIEYKVVLRNNQQNVGEIDYVFYAKLENEKGDDSKKADGTPSYTTCPKCSETLLTFNIDKISGALSYKLAGSSQSGEVVVSPEGSLYLSDIRYTKIATLTFNLPSISFSSNKLEELRAFLEKQSEIVMVHVGQAENTSKVTINLNRNFLNNQISARPEISGSSSEDFRFDTSGYPLFGIENNNDGFASAKDIERKYPLSIDKDNIKQDACCEIVIHGLDSDKDVFGGGYKKSDFNVKPVEALKDGVYGEWQPNPTDPTHIAEQHSVCRNEIPKLKSDGEEPESVPELSLREVVSASVKVYGLTQGEIKDISWKLKGPSTGGDDNTLSFDMSNLRPGNKYKLQAGVTDLTGAELECSLTFKTKPEVWAAPFQRAGDCRIYNKLLAFHINEGGPVVYGTDYLYRGGGGGNQLKTRSDLTLKSNPDNHIVVVVRTKDKDNKDYILAAGEFKDKPYGDIEFVKDSTLSAKKIPDDQLIYFQACLIQNPTFEIKKWSINHRYDIQGCGTSDTAIPFAFGACPIITDWNFRKNGKTKAKDRDLYTSLGLCMATKEFTYKQLITQSDGDTLAIPPLPLWYPTVEGNEAFPLNLYAARFNPEPCQAVVSPGGEENESLCYQVNDTLYERVVPTPVGPNLSNTDYECGPHLADRYAKVESSIYEALKIVKDIADSTVGDLNEKTKAVDKYIDKLKNEYGKRFDLYDTNVNLLNIKFAEKNSACITTRNVRLNGSKFSFPICPTGEDVGDWQVIVSPLILDITGKGINISRTAGQAVAFDMWGKQQPQLVDWPLDPHDVAFLVLPNKQGKVTSIKELFGNYKARNGFVALAKYDKNKDGRIDQKDKIYSRLRLWFDRNRNGQCEADELALLKKHGVQSISLNYAPVPGSGIARYEKVSTYYDRQAQRNKNIKDVYFMAYTADGQPLRSLPVSTPARSSVKK